MKVLTMMGMTILFLMTGCREQQVTQTWEQAHERAHGWTASDQCMGE